MLTDEQIRATFHAWAEPHVHGVDADHNSLIATLRRRQSRRRRQIAATTSVAVATVLVVIVATVLAVQGGSPARPAQVTVSSTATPAPSFGPNSPHGNALGHRFVFPVGWTVSPATVIETERSRQTPLVEDISAASPGNAISLDIRIFAGPTARNQSRHLDPLYPQRNVTVAGHAMVIARPVVFPTSWHCSSSPKALFNCEKKRMSAPPLPWATDTILTEGIHLDDDYVHVDSAGLTATQIVSVFNSMLSA